MEDVKVVNSKHKVAPTESKESSTNGDQIEDISGSIQKIQVNNNKPENSTTGKYNDPWFGAAFLLTVLVITIIGITKGISIISDNGGSAESDAPSVFVFCGMLFVLFCASILISMVWFIILLKFAGTLIPFTLQLNISILVIGALLSFVTAQNVAGAVILMFLAILHSLYYYWVRNRIKFASENLKTACAGIQSSPSIFFVSLMVLVKGAIWIVLWVLCLIAVMKMAEKDPNEPVKMCTYKQKGKPYVTKECENETQKLLFFLLTISLYWGQQVIMNILNCTTAGVVASWWYHPDATGAVKRSYIRSITTSFGSICFGSLIVAIIRALQQAQNKSKNGAAACIFAAILHIVGDVIEYLTCWAYVYVGIYGFDFIKAGKSTWQLFKTRGWTAIINDDLTSTVLTFGAIVIGIICGSVGLLICVLAPSEAFSVVGYDRTSGYILFGISGCIIGFLIAALQVQVIIAAIHTIFVCFAEDPMSLKQIHPKEYETLINAWKLIYPEEIKKAFGAQDC